MVLTELLMDTVAEAAMLVLTEVMSRDLGLVALVGDRSGLRGKAKMQWMVLVEVSEAATTFLAGARLPKCDFQA